MARSIGPPGRQHRRRNGRRWRRTRRGRRTHGVQGRRRTDGLRGRRRTGGLWGRRHNHGRPRRRRERRARRDRRRRRERRRRRPGRRVREARLFERRDREAARLGARAAVALRIKLGEHLLGGGVFRIELQHHLADGHRLQRKTGLGIALRGADQLLGRLGVLARLAQRLAGSMPPVGVGLVEGDLHVQLGGLGIIALLQGLRCLVLELAQIGRARHVSSTNVSESTRVVTAKDLALLQLAETLIRRYAHGA